MEPWPKSERRNEKKKDNICHFSDIRNECSRAWCPCPLELPTRLAGLMLIRAPNVNCSMCAHNSAAGTFCRARMKLAVARWAAHLHIFSSFSLRPCMFPARSIDSNGLSTSDFLTFVKCVVSYALHSMITFINLEDFLFENVIYWCKQIGSRRRRLVALYCQETKLKNIKLVTQRVSEMQQNFPYPFFVHLEI